MSFDFDVIFAFSLLLSNSMLSSKLDEFWTSTFLHHRLWEKNSWYVKFRFSNNFSLTLLGQFFFNLLHEVCKEVLLFCLQLWFSQIFDFALLGLKSSSSLKNVLEKMNHQFSKNEPWQFSFFGFPPKIIFIRSPSKLHHLFVDYL